MVFSVEPELEHRGGHAPVRSGADLSQHRRGGADPLQPRLRRCRLSLSDWRGKSPYVKKCYFQIVAFDGILPTFDTVEKLKDTTRGDGGFGSTF